MPGPCPELYWRDLWLTLDCTHPATLPPFVGSAIRGALGHLLRAGLCQAPAACAHECRHPETCRYFTLFERSRSATGLNLPKPFILLAPPPLGLEEVALGGPVNLPYRTGPPRPPESIPTLSASAGWPMPEGASLLFGLRLLGAVSSLAPAILHALARHGLSVSGAAFRLRSAHTAAGLSLYDWRYPAVPPQMPPIQTLSTEPESPSRIRIAFLSPAVFKIDNTPSFDPAVFAARFFEHALARATQVHHAFCSPAARPPRLDPPAVEPTLTGHRLFHYTLPRHSYRQEKWLDFDGVVGYLDLAGDLAAGMPWARAAEVLHFGQKATFGLGKLRVFVLD